MLTTLPTLTWNDLVHGGDQTDSLDWTTVPITFTYSAQTAIFQVLRSLRSNRKHSVLIPAFHCPSVVEPVLHAGYRTKFYGVNRRDLTIDLDDLRRQMSGDVAAVLTINYCGFPTDLGEVRQLTSQYEAVLIEDCAHSFLQGRPPALSGSGGDVGIFSFAKLVPSKVGGGYRVNAPFLKVQKPRLGIGFKQCLILQKQLGEQLINNSLNVHARRAYHAMEAWRVWLKTKGGARPSVGQEAGCAIPLHYQFDAKLSDSAMPWFVRMILMRYDLRSLVERRQRNYRVLDSSLMTYGMATPVFSPLSDEVVPWAYPLMVPHRSLHDFHFKSMGIPIYTFGEVLHPLLREVGAGKRALEDAEYLSRSLLMVPIHQRLSESNMRLFGEKISDHFRTRTAKSA